jgi:DNA polymerase IIIc chi subunit
MNDEQTDETVINSLESLVRNAIKQGSRYCIAVESTERATVLASNLGDDIKTARFLEKFARQCRQR